MTEIDEEPRRARWPRYLLGLGLLALIAAIFGPPLMRARVSRGAPRGVGDIRSMQSAQTTFASSNCGYFAADLGCLTRADDGAICIPGYPTTSPEFLDGELARETPYELGGSVRKFTPLGVPDELDAERCAAESVIDYCYSVTPRRRGTPSFSGVASGAIYVDPSGREIPCPVPPGTRLLE